MTAPTTVNTVTDTTRRHDFVLLFDVQDGNPNGDPDAGNFPRTDPETGQGLVTDVSIKRRVRDWVDIARGDEGRFKIYIQSGSEALNAIHRRAYTELGIKSTGSKQNREDVNRAREWMCTNFYDIRMFGAVMSTGVNCGQVRGPVQFTFGRSVDPIFAIDHSITRVAVTREADAEVVVAEDGATSGKQTEMGRKSTVAYGLYVAHGFFSPNLATSTGVTPDDLALLWQALADPWDRSASRGLMSTVGLYVFSHESNLGNAPAHQLFRRITPRRIDPAKPPRTFGDYDLVIDDADLPAGVTLNRLVG